MKRKLLGPFSVVASSVDSKPLEGKAKLWDNKKISGYHGRWGRDE